MVLVALTAEQFPGALVVNIRVTVPEKLAAGVYVTASGVAVWAVLLKVPPPELIDQAPVVVLPPTLAPDNVIGEGVADRQTISGPPAFTVGICVTVMVLVEVAAAQVPGLFVANVKVTVPEKLAAGV
jgi:hypothetical protein